MRTTQTQLGECRERIMNAEPLREQKGKQVSLFRCGIREPLNGFLHQVDDSKGIVIITSQNLSVAGSPPSPGKVLYSVVDIDDISMLQVRDLKL